MAFLRRLNEVLYAHFPDTLTVAECLRIARTRHDRPSLWRQADTLALPEAVLQILRATGLDQALGTQAGTLSHGQKQSLELAMVMALEPSVVLLEELEEVELCDLLPPPACSRSL